MARVLPMLGLPHLDRGFDYLVTRAQDADARPGVRVRVRFSGRLVDAFLLERRESSDHRGRLVPLERVVSPERVLTPEIAGLAEAVAERYAGTRGDVLRLAIPPRHARVEKEEAKPGDAGWSGVPAGFEPAADGWPGYDHAGAYIDALRRAAPARAVWQALPGEDWPTRIAELAAVTATTGRSTLVVVPDQRDLDRVHAACTEVLGDSGVVALAAGLGPTQRYRRWLSVLRGAARVVVGTRSAAFAPVSDLGLVVIWDDGDDSHSEPRAPYPHAREVLMLRAHRAGCAAVIGAFSRTAEAEALVRSGWAHDLVAPRATVRTRSPLIVAPGDSDFALARDPLARASRIPAVAFEAARQALDAARPVLVQVPRAGYIPALSCANCRTPARCRRCNGPLRLPEGEGDLPAPPTCRWCGTADARYRCGTCGSRALRAVVVGTVRTAEELGNALPGVVIRTSSGTDVRDEIPGGASLVVATPGAEPHVDGGYGAALLLDGWALLGRPDLRATEQTLHRWFSAAALVRPASEGGRVVVMADPGLAVVQALIRWDPIGHAGAEWEERAEVGFPPAVHMVAVDGTHDAITELLDLADLPPETVHLGPVDLPPGVRGPAGEPAEGEGGYLRLLLRVPRERGQVLASALRVALAVRSARRTDAPLRVQVDPVRIG